MLAFWRLISVFVCLAGFFITGILLLTRGEDFPSAVVKAILIFVGLLMVQNFFGTIYVATVGKEPAVQDDEKLETQSGEQSKK